MKTAFDNTLHTRYTILSNNKQKEVMNPTLNLGLNGKEEQLALESLEKDLDAKYSHPSESEHQGYEGSYTPETPSYYPPSN